MHGYLRSWINLIQMRNKTGFSISCGTKKFTVADFGTIVRTGDGNVAGVFPTEQEAYEYFESEETEEYHE